jgi:hypothetical protein
LSTEATAKQKRGWNRFQPISGIDDRTLHVSQSRTKAIHRRNDGQRRDNFGLPEPTRRDDRISNALIAGLGALGFPEIF